MKLKTKNNLLIYAIPTLAALLVRVVLLINWWDSPVRWYCNISGLDMQTILQTGEWFYNGVTTFALYKAILTAILFLNKGAPCPEAVVIIQLIGGILIAPLVAWCTLRLWGKTYWALASGLLAALYAPAIMYQVVVLKESILLFFALLSLSAVLWAHKRHFSPKSLWICGMFLALACICRMNALPFCGLASLWIIVCLFKRLKGVKKAILFRTSFLALGILTVFVPISIINARLTEGNSFLPVQMPSIEYISKLGSIVNPTSMNVSPSTPKTTSTKAINGFMLNMTRKIPSIFSASEIPNNVNYYFLKHKLFPLQYLIGPFLLIPLAVTALILLIFNRGILRKESILFVFILSYMLPMCYFVPLARYRLVLIPVFCMLAPYPVFTTWKAWRSKKLLWVLLPVVLWAIILYINLPLNSFLRATDFVSYGKGINFKTGKSTSALPYFHEAYQKKKTEETIVNFADALIKNRRSKDAVMILLPAFKKSPNNPAYRYYLGIALLQTGRPGQAESLFSKINPDVMGNLKIQYYYYFGESLRVQKKHEVAAKLYREALKINPNKQQIILLEKSLRACNGK
jgi:tetratricopeptide (TPR) repeat protein